MVRRLEETHAAVPCRLNRFDGLMSIEPGSHFAEPPCGQAKRPRRRRGITEQAPRRRLIGCVCRAVTGASELGFLVTKARAAVVEAGGCAFRSAVGSAPRRAGRPAARLGHAAQTACASAVAVPAGEAG